MTPDREAVLVAMFEALVEESADFICGAPDAAEAGVRVMLDGFKHFVTQKVEAKLKERREKKLQ